VYYTRSVRFTWDPRKAASNREKHGVTFDEACSVFVDPLALIAEDANHAERSLITGMSVASRIVVTVFIETIADEGNDTIRIISARLATKRERRRYEEGEES
jgi:uncharacterized DUF497 family protein